MPLFGRSDADASTATWEPEAADGRLASTAGATPGGVFTSDLSVSEYVLIGEAGFEPLGFVVGSSIYHIGVQGGKWSQNQELQVLTQAMYNARELAMSRMVAEADHLGADGVVGVQLRMQQYVWGQEVLEFIATGTAVRAAGDKAGVHQGAGRPRVHLRPIGAGLLPAARRRRGSGVVRARDVRLPHRPSVDHADDPPDGPEPGDAALHPGRLRGARARALTDAGRGRDGAGRTGSSG